MVSPDPLFERVVTESYVRRPVTLVGVSPAPWGGRRGVFTPCAQVEPSGSVWSARPWIDRRGACWPAMGGGVVMMGDALWAQSLAHWIGTAVGGAWRAGGRVVPDFVRTQRGCDHVGLLIRRGAYRSICVCCAVVAGALLHSPLCDGSDSVCGRGGLGCAVVAFQDCLLTHPWGGRGLCTWFLVNMYMVRFYVH